MTAPKQNSRERWIFMKIGGLRRSPIFFSALSCIAMHDNKYLFFNNSLKYMREKIIIKKHDY